MALRWCSFFFECTSWFNQSWFKSCVCHKKNPLLYISVVQEMLCPGFSVSVSGSCATFHDWCQNRSTLNSPFLSLEYLFKGHQHFQVIYSIAEETNWGQRRKRPSFPYNQYIHAQNGIKVMKALCSLLASFLRLFYIMQIGVSLCEGFLMWINGSVQLTWLDCHSMEMKH